MTDAPRKRIMRALAISEISAVDKPAQEYARVAIMKRDDGNSAPIPAIRKEETTSMSYQNVDRGSLAMLALDGLATALRKREPDLSPEQAFSRVFVDPANHELAKAERQASRERLAGFPVARTSAETLGTLSDEEIHAMISEERRLNPALSDRELYARVNASPDVQAHRAALRAAQEAARRDGREASPKDLAVAKRDNALGELRAKAAELRKSKPDLTEAQAFAKIYSDPANRKLVAEERTAARAALSA